MDNPIDTSKLPVRFRLTFEALEEALGVPDPPYGAQLNMARAIAGQNAELGLPMILDLWEQKPGHMPTLVTLLDVMCRSGITEKLDQVLDGLRARPGRKPNWVARYLTAVDERILPYGDFELVIDPALVAPRILRFLADGTYEHQEAQLISEVLAPGDRVLELGAGIGFMALSALTAVPGITYRAVEANPALIPLIEQSRDHNAMQFEVVNAIYGTQTRSRRFYIDLWFWASSLMRTPRTVDEIEVPEIDINDALREFRPNVLILDIEGGEYELIGHMQLDGIKRIMIEMHPKLVGDVAHGKALTDLLAQGFVIDMARSVINVLHLYRP